ncbi:MAG: FAD-dependent tricarballylate dehydrogenase TcuA [Proteobacteria bacterium]|nr:FAD-dependent tricarballylate dehydrogenase TcuA [Pseudomonadota bacterium]
MSDKYDVVVVGGGNAAFSAAMAAREQGAEVLMIERAPEDESGGNSRFTAGIMRFAFDGIDDLLKLIDLNDEEIKNTDFGTYTKDQFFDDRNGVEVLYGTRAQSLISDGIRVHGVRVRGGDRLWEIPAKAVVLACGGFEANTEMRTRYLGPGWELAKVRGTRFNTGDGIKMALDVGAMPFGNWSGCHAVGWERNAPEFGDLAVGDQFQKHSYPWGLMVNARGERFVDEGADFRNYTYAKYGRAVLEQPGQFAWQIFDQQVAGQLRDEYRIKQITKVTANTLEELAGKLEDVDPAGFLKMIKAYNAAVQTQIPYNPNVKDGRCTKGLAIDKTNWANTIEKPPFEAYATTCGITFTFGGLKINDSGNVLDTEQQPIPGLYAAGELVGGLFYFNYPGGTGLMAGAVFGKIAGDGAGKAAATIKV